MPRLRTAGSAVVGAVMAAARRPLSSSAPVAAARQAIYAFGAADHGALGLGLEALDSAREAADGQSLWAPPVVRRPQLALSADRATRIAAGHSHSAVILTTATNPASGGARRGGHLLVAGLNNAGQLGLGNRQTSWEFAAVPPEAFGNAGVLRVACGRNHTIALTENGTFAAGSNHSGQCGWGKGDRRRPASTVFHEIEALRGTEIQEVVCGHDHTLFLTSKGQLLACGWGADGQTGLGSTADTFEPQEVSLPNPVRRVSAAADTSLVLDAANNVFAWGNSEYGQTGFGSADPQLVTPRKLALDVGHIHDIAASGSCSFVLSERGLFAFGYGVLGAGPDVQESDTPLLVAAAPNSDAAARFTSLHAGPDHVAAIDDMGRAHLWGRGSWGRLGLGNADVWRPTMLSAFPGSGRTIDIACGGTHTLVLREEPDEE